MTGLYIIEKVACATFFVEKCILAVINNTHHDAVNKH